jgi:hypothetical protein
MAYVCAGQWLVEKMMKTVILDFYVFNFKVTNPIDTRDRAERLVTEYREILSPIAVDIRGIPGWLLSPSHEISMRHDSIPLSLVLSRIRNDGRM